QAAPPAQPSPELLAAVDEIQGHRDREHDQHCHTGEEADARDCDQRRPGAAAFFRLLLELLGRLDRMLEGLDDLFRLVDGIRHALDNSAPALRPTLAPCASTSRGSAARERARSRASWPSASASPTSSSTRSTTAPTGRKPAPRSCRRGSVSLWPPRRTAGGS